MSINHCEPRHRQFRFAAMTAALFMSVSAVGALPNAPLAPSTSDGTYTVLAQGCNDSSTSMTCLAQWLEERVEPNGSFTSTNGIYTNKPAGVYTYRTADFYCDYQMTYCTTRYSNTVTVTVGVTLPQRDTLEQQMLYRFDILTGNVVGDSGTDILVRRLAGGAAGNGVIDAVILQQVANKRFTAVVPTEAQIASRAWRLSSLTPRLEDINVDGYVDVVVDGVANVVRGASDQLIYSPGAPLRSAPKGVVPLGDSVHQFTANLLDYMIDNAYFENAAPLQTVYYYYTWLYCLDSYGGIDGGFPTYDICYPVETVTWDVVPDYSVFSAAAVDIWRQEALVDTNDANRSAALERIRERIASIIQVSIGGWDVNEILGPKGPHEDADYRKGLEAFLSVIGIANAQADEVEGEKSPRQGERSPDVIYIVGRYVFGSGIEKMHTALSYRIPSLNVPTWLSAFDSDTRTLFDGKLVSSTNDRRDVPALMRFTLGSVTPPGNAARYAYFFGKVVPAHEHYRSLPLTQVAPYDAVPELPPCRSCRGRNSNGYVNGLIRASGGRAVAAPQVDLDDLTGWEYPVEASYFGG
jgi:hypothetical protein